MIELIVIHGGISQPFEYWCKRCLQLRLSFIESDKCGNCGSVDIIKGEIGTLDEAVLRRGNYRVRVVK